MSGFFYPDARILLVSLIISQPALALRYGAYCYQYNNLSYGQSNVIQTEAMAEEWSYNFGSSSIQQSLRFENGKLMEIRNLGCGY